MRFGCVRAVCGLMQPQSRHPEHKPARQRPTPIRVKGEGLVRKSTKSRAGVHAGLFHAVEAMARQRLYRKLVDATVPSARRHHTSAASEQSRAEVIPAR
jgi:hypothetical protein